MVYGNGLSQYNHAAFAQKIRGHCLRMTHGGKSGHIGSMLSMADIIAVLYGSILNVNADRPKCDTRDRFILSKGHGGAAVYAALAEKGFFQKDWLSTYYKDAGKLSGHISHHVPGVEFSTGSLGHGLPVAAGMALAARHANKKHRIFCVMSDGDIDEGSTWEAIMFAAQHRMDNLVAIVDYNRIQALGKMEDVIELEPFANKIRAFGWAVKEINGHDCNQIEKTLSYIPFESGKPSFVIAKTIKGKGVSFLENTVSCHYHAITQTDLEKGLRQIGELA
ncbi:MAG: transketolase [Sedimentisphaerales bacterium]